MTLITIVKLGGSAITDKSRLCTPNLAVIQQSADAIANYSKPLILLHGGGSYAHPIVVKSRLLEGFKHKRQLRSIADTELWLDQLATIVGASLLRRGKAFVALRAMSFLTMRKGRIEQTFLRPLESALRLGLVPLIHGDLAFDSLRGISVVSADQLASLLGTYFAHSRVLFGCDVDGIFTANPKRSPGARLIRTVDQGNAATIVRKLGRTQRSDATGSMLGKVKEALKLAELGRESFVFNLTRKGLLKEALMGTPSRCTKFVGWKRRSL